MPTSPAPKGPIRAAAGSGITLGTPTSPVMSRLVSIRNGREIELSPASLSMIVPMGQEMNYRYQEMLIGDLLYALRSLRTKLG